MMYLKQFPDICREMGFDVEEKAKTVTLRVTDINVNYSINKKLFLEDLELMLDSYSEECEAIAISEADDTGMFHTEVDACHQHAEYLKAVLEKLLDKLRKEVEKARLYSASRYDFPIVMKQIDASCYKAYALAKSNNGFLVQEYIIDLDDIGKNDEKKIRAQFDELFQRTNTADSYRLLAELSIEIGYFAPVCGIFFKTMGDAVSYIKTKTDVDMTIVQSDKTNLEMIRTLDKFNLAMLLNHICADSKNRPSSTTGWYEWLGNNWNSMT
jgi:hypothetical protein